jgi:hypothetical protein
LRVVSHRPIAAALGLAVVLSIAASPAAPAASAHPNIGLERFMYALGQVESGGRYTARNSSSGAYGRYQIIPSSWRAWAREVLGSASAPMTPANQDRVAAYKLHQAYDRIRSWPAVAYWWLTGRINTNRATWSSFARSYVDKIMKIYYATSDAIALASIGGTPTYYQESYRYISWGGTWIRSAATGYAGGAAKFTDERGAWVEFRFTGRSVTWYTLRGPGSGAAAVYIDGAYAKSIDTGSSRFVRSTPIYTRTWSSSGTHTIRIRAWGTAGRPSVVVDQFVVMK